MYVAINKKFIIVCLIFILIISAVFALPSAIVSTPNYAYTIVIDAGHGGIDGGAVGKTTGKDENSLNLEYAITLKNILEKFNFKVVMTRNNLNGLYNSFSVNKKKDDMQKREEIIKSSNADLVVSIHMNSHSLRSYSGAQVFYKTNCESSEKLASSIQQVFLQTLPNARQTALVGDYYILNCSEITSVIVECGYLSNANDEALLIKPEYRDLVCYSIFVGILQYLSL